MCGICGQYNFSDEKVHKTTINQMMDTIIHRGPDDAGEYLSGNVGFGFRRLSIIDLSLGHQPMFDDEKKVCVIFNGEIYNYRELKEILEADGFKFKTTSDTEVVVYGYKKWKEDLFNRLNGMFGIAIWDNEKKKLILSRDRLGIKLVYYKKEGDKLFFGSEIRPVIEGASARPELDITSLNLFLRYRYTPSPHTIYKDIKKLHPGTMLIVENNEMKIKRWWNFKPTPFETMPSIKRAEEELSELYKQAMKRHLISDVPVGILLSGGVDSALMLRLMNYFGDNWNSFTVGFGTSFKDDELIDAKETADIFNSPNHQVLLNKEDFESSLTSIIGFLEEPIASASIVPMFHVCKKASENVKVALIGQGPDELFGGYTRHKGVTIGKYWRAVPNPVRKILKNSFLNRSNKESIQRSLYSLDIQDRAKRYQNIFSLLSAAEIDSLFKDDMLPDDPGDEIFNCWHNFMDLIGETDDLGGFQFLEMRSSLPDELLMYADKLSMAHSLELRVPYLDYTIVEYAERLKSSYKVRGLKGKFLHKRVCSQVLPQKIINRKKRAFAVNVVDDWFKDSMTGRLNNILSDDKSLIYNYLSKEKVTALLEAHRNNVRDNHKILFSITLFEEWLRNSNIKI